MKNSGIFPGAAPKVTADGITVDLMLKEPTRIARYIADITALGMFTNRIFSTGNAEGGAILYDVALKSTVVADDHTGIIPPGGAYPIIDASDGDPKVVKTVKVGGKFAITDEAQKRNDMATLQRRAQRVANTMVFDLDGMGMTAVNEALTAYDSDVLKVQSDGWVSLNKTKAAEKTAAKSIRADLNKAFAEGKKSQMGYVYNLLALHPDDELEFANAFDTDEAQATFLRSKGLEIISSPLAPKGEGWLIAEQQVGTMGVEEGITTTTYRDEDHDLSWTKTRAMLAYAVTDPLAVIKLTNLGA